ncbi:adenine phosphoribosyltransferase [Allosaccharopolyspora coralli]|uniref:Adenine phosphoribosyltransferase n=1 Tax=Allosaccharopolyspora coralli TaxID=2665642 RepID=A0A5Q3QDQ6_9PSEU|nr:adenine phosphoribosyltransferase [Allosaccharopolyspora coralli]QGK69635.1 adenine phosphoribosyltransferase [Allosaccharopolyspora coralli]
MTGAVRVSDSGTAGLRDVAGLVRDVPDFPQPGVLFRDIGPVLADPEGFAAVVGALAGAAEFDVVAGVEARGFLLGAAVAHARGVGVVGLRKPGKLPVVADRVDYDLEYGSASLELPGGVLRSGQRVLVVDDVLATGGTLAAACELVTRSEASVAEAAVVLEIAALPGRDAVREWPLRSLLVG